MVYFYSHDGSLSRMSILICVLIISCISPKKCYFRYLLGYIYEGKQQFNQIPDSTIGS